MIRRFHGYLSVERGDTLSGVALQKVACPVDHQPAAWPLGGSVAAGCLLANTLTCVSEPLRRVWYALGIAIFATLMPLGIPSVAGEVVWAAGNHYPLAVDGKRRTSLP